MKTSHTSRRRLWIIVIAIMAVIGTGWMTRQRWLPATGWSLPAVADDRSGEHADPHDHDLDEHGHDHDDATSLALSEQGLRNIGLTDDQIRPVALSTFRRSMTVPAVVVERPGRTRVQVATPMTGVVTHVHALEGEAVEPGALLFQIRLTHEDLVSAQTDFLRTLGELDVEKREIDRLTGVTSSGAVAGTVLLERQYAKDKLEALLQAQREALRLHGLSTEQVDQISAQRKLLRDLQIFAPSADEHPDEELRLTGGSTQPVAYQQNAAAGPQPPHTGPLVLQQLNVHKGQSVRAGETLATLADYDELFIEGQAFEQDIADLRRASQREWTVEAIFERLNSQANRNSRANIVEDLEIAYLANHVDVDSRTLHFYVRLPNQIAKDRRAEGHRYVEWTYLPGQRLQLRVPVEEWADQIVLPVEAVARAGAENFVFRQNGDHFDRVPVHVKYRDQYQVVIAGDGSLFPGDVVVRRGAHQLQMDLKNKAGGGVDPHAGHTH